MLTRRDQAAGFGARHRGVATAILGACLTILIGLIAAPSGLLASSARNRAASLEGALERRVAQLGVPGATAAVIQRGRPLWSGAAGTKVAGGSDAVTPHTLFITASTAKTGTAAMALRLVDEGKLGLD